MVHGMFAFPNRWWMRALLHVSDPFLAALVGAFLGVWIVSASGNRDVERRKVYLDCLHEYSLGSVVGEDLDYDLAENRKQVTAACAKLANIDPGVLP